MQPTNATTAMTDDTIMDDDGTNRTDVYRGARKGSSKKMKSKKGGSDSDDDDAKPAKSGKGPSGGKGSSSGKGAFAKKSRSSKKRGSKIHISTNTTYSSDDMKSTDTGFFDDDDFAWPSANSTKGGSRKGSSSRSH